MRTLAHDPPIKHLENLILDKAIRAGSYDNKGTNGGMLSAPLWRKVLSFRRIEEGRTMKRTRHVWLHTFLAVIALCNGAVRALGHGK